MKLRSTLPMAALVFGAGLLQPTQAESQLSGDGFLFREPTATITLHGGFSRPAAGSDLFSFVTDLFTLDRGDFNAVAVGSSLTRQVSERIGLGVSASYSARTSGSEYKDFVDQDDLPIEQQTSFVRVPILATVRVYLSPRGEAISRLAWLPAAYAPYVGVGGGAMWHRFRIAGDFFDYDDPLREIYNYTIESSGWATALEVMAGVEATITPRLAATGEATYIWSSAEMGQDFWDFEAIDLSGFALTAGLSVRL